LIKFDCWPKLNLRLREAAAGMADEFELSILDSGAQARAIAVARYGCDMAIESLSNLQLQTLFDFHDRLSAAAAGRAPVRPTATELEQFGKDLFALLVQGGIKTIYDRLPSSYVRLQIYSNRPDLQAIPWEYIQQPGTPPGPNAFRSVVRVIPTIGVPAPIPRKLNGSIRMLFVYAEPARGPSVKWPLIKGRVEDAFKNQKQLRTNFTLDVVEGATTDSFIEAFAGVKYDILHIVCHGELAADGTASLVFQDIKGSGQDLISAAKLGVFLKDKELGLVVLSACNTSAGDYSKEFATIAKTLVESGIPAVIANQFEIQNSLAATFAGAFYGELLASGDVDHATTKGRLSLDFRGELNNAARIDWGIPTLYRHLFGAKVFQT
jgi:CHAT domain